MNVKQNRFKHLTDQPFIVATGVAAFAHSTWTLGTWFAGMQPAVTAPMFANGLNGLWVAQSLHLIMWLLPAALIAFALDVGQIATSRDIQRGQRTATKYATFAVFAVATYYLQWLYLAHHMPVVDLSGGIRADMRDVAGYMRDLSIWLIPLLLPLSTLLYTFSHSDAERGGTSDASTHVEHMAPPVIRVEAPIVAAVRLPAPEPERALDLLMPDRGAPVAVAAEQDAKRPSGGGGGNATGEIDASLQQLESGRWQTSCICGKHFESDSQLGAKRAAAGHRAKCAAYKLATQAVEVQS